MTMPYEPQISVILPTIRPIQALRSVNSIPAACEDVSYEVVVVSDVDRPEAFDHHAEVQWIQQARTGIIPAILRACTVARGTYFFLFNDESVLASGALKKLHEAIRSTSYLRKIVTVRHEPMFNFSYYGLSFAPFPFAHRLVLDSIGGLVDPVYKSFYADPDLSMRAHRAGIPIEVVPDAVIYHGNDMNAIGHQENISQYLERDRLVFRSRWDHLGPFKDPS